MDMIAFVGIQLAVIAFGAAVATLAATIAIRRKNKSAAYFAGFSGGATLNHISSLIEWVHASLTGHLLIEAPFHLRLVPWALMACGLILMIASPSRFAHSVAGIKPGKFLKALETCEIVVSVAGALTLLFVPPLTVPVQLTLLALLLEVLARSSAYLLFRGTPGMEPVSRRLSLATIAVTTLFPVVYAIASAGGSQNAGETTSYAFAGFFAVGMSLMCVVVVRSFDHPPYTRDGKITDYFATKFSLSKRETEIADFILKDADNKTIAETLSVSVRTVENHLHSIYGKTEVKSRLELARLLRSSS